MDLFYNIYNDATISISVGKEQAEKFQVKENIVWPPFANALVARQEMAPPYEIRNTSLPMSIAFLPQGQCSACLQKCETSYFNV